MIEDLKTALSERILVLDGAMGTQIQRYGLKEEDYRGGVFADHPQKLKGCNDVLCLTRPDVIAEIHSDYLDAGADIIEANSFNANAVSMADYGLASYVKEINRAAAAIARREADKRIAAGRQCWVAEQNIVDECRRGESRSPRTRFRHVARSLCRADVRVDRGRSGFIHL